MIDRKRGRMRGEKGGRERERVTREKEREREKAKERGKEKERGRNGERKREKEIETEIEKEREKERNQREIRWDRESKTKQILKRQQEQNEYYGYNATSWYSYEEKPMSLPARGRTQSITLPARDGVMYSESVYSNQLHIYPMSKLL